MFPAPASAAVMGEQPAVYDQVKVPQVPPGKYVVGFRYDCDATAQVCEYNTAPLPHHTNDELGWLR